MQKEYDTLKLNNSFVQIDKSVLDQPPNRVKRVIRYLKDNLRDDSGIYWCHY